VTCLSFPGRAGQSAAPHRRPNFPPRACNRPLDIHRRRLSDRPAQSGRLSEADHRRLEQILTFAMNIEQACDVVDRNLLPHASKAMKRGLAFSQQDEAELSAMMDRLIANLRTAASVSMTADPRAARLLADEKSAFRDAESAAMRACRKAAGRDPRRDRTQRASRRPATRYEADQQPPCRRGSLSSAGAQRRTLAESYRDECLAAGGGKRIDAVPELSIGAYRSGRERAAFPVILLRRCSVSRFSSSATRPASSTKVAASANPNHRASR